MIRQANRRRGFTLLEVLLALSLAVVLLSLLSFTINVYMKASDAGRGEVERAQLARVLLRRMADDLRSTLWRNEGEPAATEEEAVAPDAESGAASGTGSASGTGGSSGTGSGTGSATGAGSQSGSGEANSGDSSSTSVSDSTALPPVMGLYGNQYEVQVDVSRLPRIEQYASAMTGTTDIVSDVKTVAYYCQSATTGAAGSATGLTRREFDRAVTNYASMNGDISAWEQNLAPLAQEVAAVEFQYIDGKREKFTEWDSEAKKALPMAVEIAIALNNSTASADAGQTIYRLLVFIPQSQAPQTSGASAMETMVSSSVSSAAAGAAGEQAGAAAGGIAPQGGGSSGRGGGFGPGGAPGGEGGPRGGDPEGGGPGGGGQGGGDRGGQGGDEDDEEGERP